MVAVALLSAMVALALRLRRARGDERLQPKWFRYSVVVVVLALPVSLLVVGDGRAFAALTPLVPLSAAFAILKYRLYDIDVIINRTLVYGLLTVSLVLVYVGSVVALRGLVFGFTGRSSQLVVVASTLAVAALFVPLRRRIQGAIDRRFYRKKYDAAKTLEAFSARLRDETDLEALGADLVGVVRETVQPAHARLWLRPRGRGRKVEAGREKNSGRGAS